MRTEITFAIDFIIRLNKTQRDKALLYARVTVNGDRKEISLKHSFNAKDWDGRQEIVKGKSQEVRSINNYINTPALSAWVVMGLDCGREVAGSNPTLTSFSFWSVLRNHTIP